MSVEREDPDNFDLAKSYIQRILPISEFPLFPAAANLPFFWLQTRIF